jgi:hypothetical protein
MVTTTGPVVAPAGTGTFIRPEAQLAGEPKTPLNVITFAPWLDPKFEPETLTICPTGPDAGDRLEIVGLGTTVNFTPLLALLFTVTTTFPVVAPVGTVATMAVSLHEVTDAASPLNLIVLVPWALPKLEPLAVTEPPITPEDGLREDICKGTSTVNGSRLVWLNAAVRKTSTVPDGPEGTVNTSEVSVTLVMTALYCPTES